MITIIVDANILFSALITPNGKIAKILSHPALQIRRISCHFLLTELSKHQIKIVRTSKRETDAVVEDINYFINHITLYNEQFLQQDYWKEAEKLTSGVDHFDIPYVALAMQTGGILWTGDKKLHAHLRAMGFDQVMNTTELYDFLAIV